MGWYTTGTNWRGKRVFFGPECGDPVEDGIVGHVTSDLVSD